MPQQSTHDRFSYERSLRRVRRWPNNKKDYQTRLSSFQRPEDEWSLGDRSCRAIVCALHSERPVAVIV
jgi:hypothetical protein